MTSQKQIEANRQNAKRSTGPKSAKGKKVSRMNATTHGLTAQQIVMEGEDLDEFEILKTELIKEFDPVSVIERELVALLASYIWRNRRVPVQEVAIMEAEREAINECESDSNESKIDVLAERAKRYDPVYTRQQMREHSMRQYPDLPQPFCPYLDDPNFVPEEVEPLKLRDEVEVTVTVETDSELARKAMLRLGRALLRDTSPTGVRSKLARYETHLVNMIERILDRLRKLKEQRRPEDKSGPAVIEHEPLKK